MRRHSRTVVLSLLLAGTLWLFIWVTLGQSSTSPFQAGTSGFGLVQAGLGGLPPGGNLYFPQVRLGLGTQSDGEVLEGLNQAAEGLEGEEGAGIEAALAAASVGAGDDDGTAAAFVLAGDDGGFLPIFGLAGVLGGGALLASNSGGGSGSTGGTGSQGVTQGGGGPNPDGEGGSGGGEGGEGGSGGGGGAGGEGGSSGTVSTPEPSTFALLGTGLAVLLRRRFTGKK